MKKKVVIVGGVAGGASTAARLRRIDEEVEIVMFEKGEYISFANCGLPYHIGGVIEKREKLLIQTPEAMGARFRIDVRVKNEVTAIDREKKEVIVKDIKNNKSYRESYDYLILSPGAEPIKPPLPGLDGDNVFTLRNIPDMDSIIHYIDKNKVERAVVVGAGYIGLKMAENMKEKGMAVSLVEMADQVLTPLDYEMAALVHNELRKKGIKLHLKDGITGIVNENNETEVVLQSEKKISTDLVILAIGVRPSAKLADEAGLALGKTGGIKVNEYLQTSDENIYALGDAIEVTDLVTGEPALIPLAGPANKQGRIVANNISGKKETYKGTQGTAIAKVFDLTAGSTGSNEKRLHSLGIDYKVSYTTSRNHAGYYPGAAPMTVKTIFTPDDGRLLGAQVVGHDGVDKRLDLFAVAVRQGMNVFDLQEMELSYAPPFGSAKDPVNMAGFVAGNILNGMMEPIRWQELDDIDEDAVLLDVREEVENKLGRIEGSLNIPLNSLRDRLDELDKDKEIIVYCAVGLRGYLGCRILMEHGFKKVKNLVGGYRLYSTIEHDQKKIIEGPNYEEFTSISNPEEGKKVGKKLVKEE